MSDLFYLFIGLCIVAAIPGPLAVVAFQGGTENARSFLTGLAGQLLGLILMTSLLIYFGTRTELISNKWLPPLAAGMMMILGIKSITSRGKAQPAAALTFASTFTMAFSNPKAIFGFGPQLILFTSNDHLVLPVMWANLALVLAVSLTMTVYFVIGRFFRDRRIIARIRILSGAVLMIFSVYILFKHYIY
jgi:threonine/homoserine/homoserine lactone efflux protein